MSRKEPINVPPKVSSEPLIALEGIGVRHGRGWALKDVDFTVHAGEIVVIVGPNGAGKSTLLKAALGIVPTTEGTVRRKEGLRVSYVPQRLSLDPVLPMSVERFLRLGQTERADRNTLTMELERVGMEPVLHRQLADLSGGELQRVLLARALMRKPHLMVLDEPVSGVDLMGQGELYTLIGQARATLGCAVMMVSHDLYLVMAGADRVVCLNGFVCCAGKPEDVSRHPDYLALFGDRLPPTVAVYSHHHDHSCGHDHGHAHTHTHAHPSACGREDSSNAVGREEEGR